MFQEGRQHLRQCVNIEIYSCILVQLRSVEFIFDLHLSVQGAGGSAKRATRTPQFRRGFGKTNKSLPELESAVLMSFSKWSAYLLLISTVGWWCIVRAGRVIRSRGHSHCVFVLFFAFNVHQMFSYESLWNLLSSYNRLLIRLLSQLTTSLCVCSIRFTCVMSPL